MNIKTRVRCLFRRKSKGTVADIAGILEGLEREARNLAELTFETSLVNSPRSREQIEKAASTMFQSIAQKSFSERLAQGGDPDIAASASHIGVETMHETFMCRYDELIAHGNAGSEARQ
jgi:hypothetical protein